MKTRSPNNLGHLFPVTILRLLTTVMVIQVNKLLSSILVFLNVTVLCVLTSCFLIIFCVGEKPNALAEPRGEEESLTVKGKKKKTVHWAEEEQLKHYFYFDLDETERGKAGISASSCIFRLQPSERLAKSEVTNLGFKIDADLKLDSQMQSVVRSSFCHLRQLAKTKAFLTKKPFETMNHAFTTTQLNYCNGLYCGVSQLSFAQLQLV